MISRASSRTKMVVIGRAGARVVGGSALVHAHPRVIDALVTTGVAVTGGITTTVAMTTVGAMTTIGAEQWSSRDGMALGARCRSLLDKERGNARRPTCTHSPCDGHGLSSQGGRPRHATGCVSQACSPEHEGLHGWWPTAGCATCEVAVHAPGTQDLAVARRLMWQRTTAGALEKEQKRLRTAAVHMKRVSLRGHSLCARTASCKHRATLRTPCRRQAFSPGVRFGFSLQQMRDVYI